MTLAPSAVATGPVSATGRPLDLSPEAFGELRRSKPDEDVEVLRARLAADGYLFLPGLLDRDEVLAARRDVMARMLERGRLPQGPDRDELERFGVAAATGPTGPGGGHELDEIPTFSVRLQELLYGPRFLSWYERLFAEPVRHFDYTWLRMVGPGDGTPPHMDTVFMNRGTPNLLTAWTPLGDIDRTLGGLAILEGSHRLDDVIKGYGSLDVDSYCLNSTDPELTDPLHGRHKLGYLGFDAVALRSELDRRWLTADYRAGDVLTFTMYTAHLGLDNMTKDRYRLSTDTRYQRASDPADHRWIGPHPVSHDPSVVKGLIC